MSAVQSVELQARELQKQKAKKLDKFFARADFDELNHTDDKGQVTNRWEYDFVCNIVDYLWKTNYQLTFKQANKLEEIWVRVTTSFPDEEDWSIG